MLNFIKNLSPVEVVVIALILIVFFGAKVVTIMGRVSGETLKEVKNIKKNFTEAVEGDSQDEKKEVSK